MYVLVKPGETVYYGVHRTPHAQGNLNQGNLIISTRWSNDGTGAGTLGNITKLYRDSASTRQTILLTNQAGVIADTVQNRVGPKVGGLPVNGYTPLSYSNTTAVTQHIWFEFVQQGENAMADGERFSVYDFWDFTVKTAAGVTKPGRLFSKQWAFSAGDINGRFSAEFNMYPLIPSPKEPGKYFVKKFELAGLAPQNFFRFVANSMGADPALVTPNDFLSTTKSQTTAIDYPEYLSFVNDPDPELWPSAADPDLRVVSTASYCNGTGGVMEFFLRSTLGGKVNIIIDLDGVPGYQASGTDVLITQTIPVGNSRIQWNGRNGLGAVVVSGTPVSLTFKNDASPIAPVNFPVLDAENNLDGFRIQNVRPGSPGFDVLYWDDSNLQAARPAKFPTPFVELTGASSRNGVHAWGGPAGDAKVDAGDNYLINTYTYGNTEQQTQLFIFSYLCDPDGDGIGDVADIDQDNDGITNSAESGGVNPAFITTNNVPRYLDAFEANFVDINSDGVNDVYDLDLDGRPNFLDIDADGDGIPDAIEANGGTAPTGYDASLSRFPSTDVGANGMPDAAETTAESGATKLSLTNTDNIGRPDYLDIDADNDGIVDNIEAQTSAAYRAPTGVDTDLDGLDNRYDLTPGGTATAGVAVPLTNIDSDTLPDYRDLNSDNDSRTDVVEGWDTNNDGVAEKTASGLDADNDGLDDAFDNDVTRTNPTNNQTPQSFPNVNMTGTPELDWRETFVPVISATISGRVFEDVNYGGGAGRDYATANTSATTSGFTAASILRGGVAVELYYASGGLVATTTTTNGTYSFSITQPGSYTVRVVSRTGFTSVRTPAATGLVPVQTFAYGQTNLVGGQIPNKADATANTGTQTLDQITNGTTTTAHSLAAVSVPTTAAITNVDFGFNFDVISNTNDAGQGSLRQFIINSNALANTNLAQAGLLAGKETSIFMIGDGRTANVPAGLRSGVNGGFNTAAQTATITLASALPFVTGNNTVLDGSRQTAVTGDNVPAVTGTTTGPEVILDFATFRGLEVSGGIFRIASLGLANAKGASTNNVSIAEGAAIHLINSPNSTVTDVTITGSNTVGIRLNNADQASITNNVVLGNINQTTGADGIGILGGTVNVSILGNTISNNRNNGIEFTSATNNTNTISGNTIRANGGAGVAILSGNDNLISANTITGNTGDGILAHPGTSGNRFTQNSIATNSGLGIDLSATTAAAGDDVSRNADGKTAGSGANGLLNFPVITQAVITDATTGNLKITGVAPAGSTIEFFLADRTTVAFGQGQTYIFSSLEGGTMAQGLTGTSVGINDQDARVGSYSGTNNGLDSGSETNASRFSFSVPMSSLTSAQRTALTTAGARLTATATLNGTTTSEFSANIPIGQNQPLPVELTKFEAMAQTNNALLTWTTASEKNNDRFEVEHSRDGITFERVGTVKGNGTTASLHQYSFVEEGAGRFGKQLYYRLRQVDTDGTEAFSPVRTVTFAPQAVQATLYPNPATTTTTLDLSTLPAGTYSVTLVDMTGRTLLTQAVQGGRHEKLSVNALPAGTYLVQVRGAQLTLTQRLVKQH